MPEASLTMPEGVAGNGLAAEAAHDEGLPGRLEVHIQLLTLPVKQGPGDTNTKLWPLPLPFPR